MGVFLCDVVIISCIGDFMMEYIFFYYNVGFVNNFNEFVGLLSGLFV